VRKRSRGAHVASNAADEESGHRDGAFSEEGAWVEPPAVWGLPDVAFESGQFWKTYLKCCELMPEKHAMVFSMREVVGLSTEEICKNLELTTSNLHVILYRARLSLRACMTKNWFGAEHG
jgi:RNA polymerase sigma-70 factor (ECF subfamily)